ncbi:uncharacterized protein [Dysidea avara]|uniref:uncharacterized protein isoform X2 n=1 Tax=Dysidea avara TaxID=196820 RepID=UPI00331DAFF9
MAIQNLSLNDSGAYSYCTSNKCGKSCVSAILHVAPDNVLDSSDSSVDPSIVIWMVVIFAVILLWLLIMYCCLPRITRRCRTGGLFGQNRHHDYNAIGAISPHEQQSHYDDYYKANMNIGRPRPNEQSGHRGSDANMNIGRPRPNEQNGRHGPDANVNIGRPRPNEQSGHCGFDGAPRALSIGERAKQRPPLQITDFRLVYNVLRQGAISSWKPLGMQLGLTSDKLNEISADCRDNDYERHIERVFELWKQQSQKRTWKDLIRAIEVTTVNPQLCMDLSVKHLADFDDKVLDKDLSNEVLIPMAKYWFELGLALGIDETQLDNIPVADSSQGFRKMLHTWWQQNFAADRTWNTIVFSLDAVNLSVFAKEVYDSRIGAE